MKRDMKTITTDLSPDRHSALLEEVRRIVDQLPAAELLARQPHTRLPLMSWDVQDGALVGRPPACAEPAEARAAFAAWVRQLGLHPDPQERCGGATLLHVQGNVDGIPVTVWASTGRRPARGM